MGGEGYIMEEIGRLYILAIFKTIGEKNTFISNPLFEKSFTYESINLLPSLLVCLQEFMLVVILLQGPQLFAMKNFWEFKFYLYTSFPRMHQF